MRISGHARAHACHLHMRACVALSIAIVIPRTVNTHEQIRECSTRTREFHVDIYLKHAEEEE